MATSFRYLPSDFMTAEEEAQREADSCREEMADDFVSQAQEDADFEAGAEDAELRAAREQANRDADREWAMEQKVQEEAWEALPEAEKVARMREYEIREAAARAEEECRVAADPWEGEIPF